MFIQERCPRCDSNLRQTSGDKWKNCFFCEGYNFAEAIRKEWFLEETRRSGRRPQREPVELS
jgi:hypothetical protein